MRVSWDPLVSAKPLHIAGKVKSEPTNENSELGGIDINKSAASKLREKHTTKKAKECHLVINDDKVTANGFTISFRLSKAYRAIERQEVSASKPTLKPFVRRRRKRVTVPEQDTELVPQRRSRNKNKDTAPKSFWKQMISVKARHDKFNKTRVSPKRRSSSRSRSRHRSSSGEKVKTKSDSLVATAKSCDKTETSLAAQEWERRSAIRRRNKRDKMTQLKNASSKKKKNAIEPSATLAITSHRRKSNGLGSASKYKPLFLHSTGDKIPLATNQGSDTVAEKQSLSSKTANNIHTSSVSLASTSEDGEVLCERRGSSIWSGAHSISSGSPSGFASNHYRSMRSLNTGSSSGGGSILSDEKVSVAETITTDVVALPESTTQETVTKHVATRYSLELNHAKPLIPKPDHLVTRAVKSARTEEEMENGKEKADDKTYATARYLYSMCNCEKVGRPRTINKLLGLRKISGVIRIYGCPQIESDTNLVCPFCQIFPRRKVYAWMEDQSATAIDNHVFTRNSLPLLV